MEAPGMTDPWLMDAADVVRMLGGDAGSGLTSAEAAERLARVGPNRLHAAPEVPAWRKLLLQFADPLVYLLIAATVVSLVAWALEGADGTPYEAIVIAVIVVANAVLGFVQERKAERAVAALQRMAATTVGLLRDGRQLRLPTDEVVPGDILVLREGDAVGADGRLLETASLQVAEAPLTGESEPVVKDAATLSGSVELGDRTNMVFSGTAVTRGGGRAVVTATGMDAEMGRIASMLERTKEERTPLQREIDRLGRILGIAVIAIAVVVVLAIALTSDLRTASDLVEVLLIGVSLAVAAVPESLSAVLTVVLALGVRRMAQQHAIVTKLSSVETLGSASVICTDKTGTLTRNEMTIQRIVTRSGAVTATGVGYDPTGRILADGEPLGDGRLLEEVRVVVGGGSLANEAILHRTDGAWTIQGDPTDAAFLVAERKLGITDERTERFTRAGLVPFTSERGLMSSVVSDGRRAGRWLIITKGAPDILLTRCTRERVGTEDLELTQERRAQILKVVDHLGDEALRTLGVALRVQEGDPPRSDESAERDLVFAGVVGMIDPPRPEAVASIAEAQRAGIRVVMITGDHPRTAARIASDLGIEPDPARRAVVSGRELDDMDDEAFARTVRSVSAFARVAPEHKLRIVDALQADGNIVAMTGDGVNDAPALKAADIGIAMGITGTEVAKEAAKMILADDNFATIVAAVREGRAIFANIRKFLRYLLSSNIGEVLTMLLGVVGASVIGLRVGAGAVAAPLLATQILWINLVTDSGPALAMGVDPPPRDVMERAPRRTTDRMVDRGLQLEVLFVGLIMALVTLLTIDMKLPGGLIPGSGDLTGARTAGFTVLVLAQLFNCFNARSGRDSAFRNLFTNPLLWAAIGLSLVAQVAVVHVSILNEAFDTAPLSAGDWALCMAMASLVLWVEELRKLIVRIRARRPAGPRRATGPADPDPASPARRAGT
jgi:magnesium-transporting ATPase (P-type)